MVYSPILRGGYKGCEPLYESILSFCLQEVFSLQRCFSWGNSNRLCQETLPKCYFKRLHNIRLCLHHIRLCQEIIQELQPLYFTNRLFQLTLPIYFAMKVFQWALLIFSAKGLFQCILSICKKVLSFREAVISVYSSIKYSLFLEVTAICLT